MQRILIHKDGAVTGDISSIIAYEGQRYSEPIQFSYPALGQEYLKYIQYSWGTTQFEEMLDANDQVKLLIFGPGVIRVQFVAKEVLTGVPYFMSKPFDMIVRVSLGTVSVSSDSNCYRNGCNSRPSPMPPHSDAGLAEQMVKFGIQLEEEQRVRAANDSYIWNEITSIKNALNAAGIHVEDPIATIEDCNKLIEHNIYHLKEGSLNTPEGVEECESPWIIDVKTYNAQVLQTAYSADDGDTRIYYRTGTMITAEETTWLEWIPMIHEANVEYIE